MVVDGEAERLFVSSNRPVGQEFFYVISYYYQPVGRAFPRGNEKIWALKLHLLLVDRFLLVVAYAEECGI